MEIQTPLLIVPNLIYDVILGADTLAKLNRFYSQHTYFSINDTTHNIKLYNNPRENNIETVECLKLIKPEVRLSPNQQVTSKLL